MREELEDWLRFIRGESHILSFDVGKQPINSITAELMCLDRLSFE